MTRSRGKPRKTVGFLSLSSVFVCNRGTTTSFKRTSATRRRTADILNLDTIDNLHHWRLANGHNLWNGRDSMRNE